MYPPPTTSSRAGISGSSSASREVHNPSPSSNGMTGREPVARMQCLKSIPETSECSSVSERGPAKRARPRTTSIPRCFRRLRTPLESPSTTPCFQPRRLARSIAGAPKPIPIFFAVAAPWITSTAWISVFDGMQPSSRQTPPRASRSSTSSTSRPRSAARIAAT